MSARLDGWMAASGQEGRFPRPRLNGRCRLRKRSSAANNQATEPFGSEKALSLVPATVDMGGNRSRESPLMPQHWDGLAWRAVGEADGEFAPNVVVGRSDEQQPAEFETLL